MNDTITNFLEAKKQATDLEGAARKEMQTEFNGLLNQAAELAETFKNTFGGKLAVPANLRFSVVGKPAKKRKAKTTDLTPAITNGNGKKIGALKRSLISQQEKLAEATAAGKPTKPFEDRIYEITDELTLLGAAPATPTTAPAAEATGELEL